MIYWFSGTGNSRFVAEKLAELTNDTAQNIFMPYTEEHDGIVGLVFPVYGENQSHDAVMFLCIRHKDVLRRVVCEFCKLFCHKTAVAGA